VKGASIRKLEGLLKAPGLTGIEKSRVSRICKELDQAVHVLRNRPLQGNYPYLWLDALYLKVRQDHCIVSQAMVIAIGVHESGETGDSEFCCGRQRELCPLESFPTQLGAAEPRRCATGGQ